MSPPVYDDGRVVIHEGHVLDELRALAPASIHTVVTSPPYWGLRDYGLQPKVWGGEPACAHEWDEDLRRHRGGPTGATSQMVHRAANDARDVVADIPASAFCRCGAWRGQLGLEPTPELYVEHLVTIFREVRRVLRDDGTFWLNLGDCYHTGDGYTAAPDGTRHVGGLQASNPHSDFQAPPVRRRQTGLKPKDLVGVPWMIAFALRTDGWWLRSEIIWAKGISFCPDYSGSVMPESVTDRPTRAHEQLFLLTKSETYYYDTEAVRERARSADEIRWDPGTDGHEGGVTPEPGASTRRFRPGRSGNVERVLELPSRPNDHRGSSVPWEGVTRNLRSVWAISPKPYLEAHFATFPPNLVKPCILAGTSERGCCPACGAPWERIVERSGGTIGKSWHDHHEDLVVGQRGGGREHPRALADAWESGTYRRETNGWRPTCAHYDERYRTEFRRARRARRRGQQERTGMWWTRARERPGRQAWPTHAAVVADPFAGAGTVLVVAQELGRRAVGCELKPEYVQLMVARLPAQAVLPLAGQ